jgi:predicted ATP-dependent protease
MIELFECQLRKCCEVSDFHPETSKNLTPSLNIIGQDRAIRAIETGLHTKTDEFNIFISGMSGTGRNSTIRILLENLAPKEKDPPDWAYVYNFKDRNFPKAISFKPGQGSQFSDDFDEFIALIRTKISDAFKSDHYETERNKIVTNAQNQIKDVYQEMNRLALEKGLLINTNPEGIFTVPAVEERPMTQEEFNALDVKEKEKLEQGRIDLQSTINNGLKKIQDYEKRTRLDISSLDHRIGDFAVQILIDDLKQQYNDNPKLITYLDEVKEDISDNIDFFKKSEDDTGDEEQNKKKEDFFLRRYKVNLVVKNQVGKGAPVIHEVNPTYYNLFGSIEYHQEMGSWVTDSSFIRGGSLLKASGGYLVLQVNDLLSSPYVWDVLKRCLKAKLLQIENLDEQVKTIPTLSLKPEPIPIHTKIILIGSEEVYNLLYHLDEDFRKFFKIRAQFDYEMQRNEKTESLYASYIAIQCNKVNENVHFTPQAVRITVDYGSRIAENQEKLTTQFTLILDIVKESIHWAQLNGRDVVNDEDVRRTLKEKRYRGSLLEEKVHTSILEGRIHIEVVGEKVGQINGLSIIGNGEYMFGQPSRITATAFPGKGGVMSVDKESEMSGPIFDKGAMIINSYIAHFYGQEFPLPVSVSLAFEQNYSGIDGDSASAAEIIVSLSAISRLPIRQDIAITGSTDQLGNMQPIGGVNAKIEGFFDICKEKGLTGKQGVVIPRQNQKNLMLAQRIINAVNNGLFHVYAVDRIEEAIEVLFDKKAGEADEKGNFPENTVNFFVSEALHDYHELEEKSKHMEEDECDDDE